MPKEVSELQAHQIKEWFTYHSPKEGQQERYRDIREGARQFALVIAANSQQSADQTAAFRLLRECVMTVNQGIALESELESHVFINRPEQGQS